MYLHLRVRQGLNLSCARQRSVPTRRLTYKTDGPAGCKAYGTAIKLNLLKTARLRRNSAPAIIYGSRRSQSSTEKSSLPTPQSGHTQSSGRSSNAVPGAMPLSGSPTSGSYTYPQVSQTYFFIILFVLISYSYRQKPSSSMPSAAQHILNLCRYIAGRYALHAQHVTAQAGLFP